MSIIFWKNLLKCLPTTTTTTTTATTSQSSSPLISQQHHINLLKSSPNHPSTAAAATTSSIMIKNFNSVYDISSASTSKSISTNSFSSTDSDSDSNSTPDLTAVFASQRFFFSSPGRSNSIVESPEPPPEPDNDQSPLDGGIAVKKYSPDPYTDFKHSMLEMIEARELKDVRANWNYLHQLLSCYLSLNPKQTHKFIISAFADIIISLLSDPDAVNGCRRHNGAVC